MPRLPFLGRARCGPRTGAGFAGLLVMPRDVAAFKGYMRRAGFLVDQSSDHFFPLGSDAAPESLRHDGSYPGCRGYWRFVRLIYTGESSVRAESVAA